jgi:hypothetical protein
MVTPEEIARAMAVHSNEDQPRRAKDSDEQDVVIDDKQVPREDQ